MTNTADQYAFNLEPGAAERDRAIEQAMAHAETKFVTAGRIAVERCCLTLPRFTTDDVWAEMPGEVRPHEPRAMAAIMKYAHDNNWAYPLNQYRPSSRKEAHRGPKRVWRSMIYVIGNALQPSYEEEKQEHPDIEKCIRPVVFNQRGETICQYCGVSLGIADNQECEG